MYITNQMSTDEIVLIDLACTFDSEQSKESRV